MRVLVTTPTWSLNGVNVFAATLVRRLRADGHDASVLLTGSLWRDEKPLPIPVDLAIERLALPGLATWRARWQALRQHLEQAAPCLYLPNHDGWHAGIAPVLSSRVGILGIAHSDDPQHYAQAQRLAPWWNAMVGVSDRITRRLRADPALQMLRIERISYGVELGEEGGGASGRGKGEPLRLLYAGRLEERQKRVSDLVSIAGALAQQGVAFRFSIVGDGPERGSLERRLREEGLADRVVLVGTAPLDMMGHLYRSHHVLLLPSAYEGLSLAMLQAMGEGVIPVVSDVASGAPEVVTQGVSGFRVPIGDVEGFSQRLADLAHDHRLCRAMGAAARDVVRTGPYGSAAMATQYGALLAEVWHDIATARYRRPLGSIVPPPGLTWRTQVRAPLAGWAARRWWRD